MLFSTNQSTIEQTKNVDGSVSPGNSRGPGAPVSATFFCDFHRGKVKQVCESIREIIGYQATYFTEGGLNAFMDIIPVKDQLALLRYYLELSELYTRKMHIPKRSQLINIHHIDGHWIKAEIQIMNLEFRINGASNGVSGRVQLLHDPKLHSPNQYLPGNDRINGYHPGQSLHQETISKREKEVLYLIAHGYSSKMVADKLCISVHTATTHRTNLLEKFHAKNTAELVLMATKKFWL